MTEKDLLAESELFQDLTDDELEKIISIASEKYFIENETIFSEGDVGEAMYLILEGTVRVERGEAGSVEVIAILYPGNVFGEIAIMDKDKRSATVQANEPLRALEITREDFEKLLASDKDMTLKCYRNFIKILCARLRATNESLTFSRSLLEGIMARDSEKTKEKQEEEE